MKKPETAFSASLRRRTHAFWQSRRIGQVSGRRGLRGGHGYRLFKAGFFPAALLLAALLSAGCRSLPPEAPSAAGSALRAPEVPEEFLWQPLEKGLDMYILEQTDPPLAVFILRADLASGLWETVLTPPGGPDGWEMEGITVPRFLEEQGCRAAVNGGPFDPYRYFLSREGQDVSGLYVWEGRVISEPLKDFFALVLDGEGHPSIRSQEEVREELRNVSKGSNDGTAAAPIRDSGSGGIRFASGGFQKLLTRGLPEPQKSARTDARTALGISRDGGTLYLLVADGRREGWSRGLTLEETGEWLALAGAWEGLNLDGGGSSILVLADGENRPRVVNRPVNHRGFPVRIVATHIGLRRRVSGAGE